MAAIFAAAAVILAVSGGFRTTVGGLRISMRSPLPIAILALVNAAVWFVFARRENALSLDLEAAWETFERHSKFVAGIALASTMVAAVFSTRSAAGADASGYLSQAAAWAEFQLPIHIELLATDYPELDGWITTPLGWRPHDSTDMYVPGVQAPTYPPGLPLLMAIPHALGGIDGASAVVIVSALHCGHRHWAAGVTAWRQHRCRDRRGVACVHAGVPPSVDSTDERRAGHGGVDDVLPVARS